MSTKIHHGYRINLAPEIGSLFEFTARLRAALTPVYEKSYGTILALMATNFADAHLRGEAFMIPDPRSRRKEAGPSVPGPHPLWDASLLLDDFKIEIDRSNERNPIVDFQFEVSFLSDPANRAPLYALIYTERDEYVAAWRSFPEVEVFEYWDNTDEPEGMSMTEWHKRRDTWNRVLPNYTTPREVGVSWSLLGELNDASMDFLRDPGKLADLMPSRIERAERIAQRLAVKQMDELRGADISSSSIQEIYRTLEAERPTREALTAKLVLEIEPTLVDLTPADLGNLANLTTAKG